jgi:hypothetical protein
VEFWLSCHCRRHYAARRAGEKKKKAAAGFQGAHLDTAPNQTDAPARSAGFQTCRIADFQVGKALGITPFAGLETHDTADLEVCATGSAKLRPVLGAS